MTHLGHPHGGGRSRTRAWAMACVSVALFAVMSCGRPAPPPAVPGAPAPLAPITSTRGMVASAHALASDAGIAMLRAGGNAVDAAVAAAFAIGVAEPNASGLGGEGMILIHLAASGRTVAIDYRSAAPLGAVYDGRPPDTGYAAAAVPGTVAGLAMALERHGTRPLKEVLRPAIALADDGFLASATLAASVTEHFGALAADTELSGVFCPGGLPLEAGGRVRNPALAHTLRAIAAGGPDVFYRGAIADRLAQASSEHGGFLTREALAAYRAIERTPVRGRYRGREVISAPPPVAGTAVIEALQILDRFDLTPHAALSAARVHLTSEALKRAFADFNAFIGDPDFERVPAAGLVAPAYAAARAAEIDPARVSAAVRSGDPDREHPSTTALAVIDRHGNAVVVTQTISDFFGAKVMVPGTGIILNNEMKNFSARGVNALAPGKRMRTAIAPTLVFDRGQVVLAIGTPGAARIVSVTAQLISNVLDYGLDIQAAIDAPRFHARDTEPHLSIEGRIPADTQTALERMGYALERYGDFDLFFGGAQGIVRDPRTGRLSGGADRRRDGAVIAY